ncbi:MAG: hypothetical protein A3K19_14965 [Lentisphaerae bacterium RIFOXYB12_FULL_65_16]|nr:MAG: hypothetical protein A3K18_01545 [Lentisphaerae bacterium RIFOXYA12_64_32]OGV85935.1 MAG: hypothetical protein A3K19_14965 [Lentisphaerae bacterium RIFOXYB12_FULL_65_16]
MDPKCPIYSVVLPVFNEEGNMVPLIEDIRRALEPTTREFEIICVDDASKDNSVSTIRDLRQKDPRIILLRHRRNFGQSAAFATGFAQARGDVVITMDSDRQNDPADIPNFLAAIADADCVCGIRQKRQDTWVKRASSRIANRVRTWLTGDSVRDTGCAFRAMRRECLRELPVFNGMHRFLPSLLRFQGRRVTQIPIRHHPRVWGRSNYGILNRGFRGLVDCLGVRWWSLRAVPQDRLLEEKGGRTHEPAPAS